MQISSLSFILAAVCSFLFYCQNHIIFFVLCVFFLKLIPFVTLSIMHLQPQNSLHLLFWKCVNKGNETKKKVVTIKKRSVFLSVFFLSFFLVWKICSAANSTNCKMQNECIFSSYNPPNYIVVSLYFLLHIHSIV